MLSPFLVSPENPLAHARCRVLKKEGVCVLQVAELEDGGLLKHLSPNIPSLVSYARQ